jgi:hypothetical protein
LATRFVLAAEPCFGVGIGLDDGLFPFRADDDPFLEAGLSSFFLAFPVEDGSFAANKAFLTGVSVRIDDFLLFLPRMLSIQGAAAGKGRMLAGVL